MKNQNQQVRWKTNNTYYDTDTGDELTELVAKTEYEIIKKEKHGKLNPSKTHGTRTIINYCARKTQLQLF